MRDLLLKTKFHLPTIRSGIVSRPRLLECLKNSLDDGNRLTLVSAPAGFGKSTLLSEFSRTCEQPVAWLSLDETEAQDAVRFWTYVFGTLQSAIPGLGDIGLAMLQASPSAEITTVLTSLINEITSQATTILLVLDDYQFIQAQAIHEAVSFLIEHAPPQFHLVLATRIDPPLNLARLRIRGQMVEVRANDLRFTQQEITALLNEVMHLNLSPADMDALEARTEGWIAGLQVAALAMRDRTDVAGFIAAFTGSHRHILSYLIEEVFTQQPEPVQRFLLETSVLDRLCGALCDVLTGRDDGQALLERLERENVFVVALDDEQCWYRYHHLFQDVLRAHLHRTYAPEAIADLHRRASEWYEHGGDIAQAIQHALRIDDFSRVAALLKDSAMDMIGAYSLTTMRGWLDALPDTLVRTTTNLSMAYAWIFLASSQPDKVNPHLQDVECILGMTADDAAASPTKATLAAPPATRCTLAEIASIRANVAFHHSDLARVLALSQQALRYLDDEAKTACPAKYAALQGIITFNMGLAYEFSGDICQATEQFELALRVNHQIGNWHLIPLSASHLAQVLQVQGKLKQAAEIYRQAIQYTEETTAPPSQLSGIAHTGLGHILYEFNDLTTAEACLQRGIALAQPWTHWETLASGALDLSRVWTAQGMWTQAHTLLQDMEARIAEAQAPWGRARLQAQRAWLWIRQNDLDAVKAWMQQTDLQVDSDLVYLRESEFIILAHAYVAVGDPQQATHLLERLYAATVQNEYTGRSIECLALLALAQSAQSQSREALATLQRALALAEPEGYIRLFVDMGQPMQTLLRQLNATPSDLGIYVESLLAAFSQTQPGVVPQPTAHPPQPLIEPLSERELELLHLIATGMTNRAIAEKLVVSVNTVKTHACNIYSKLGVRNRTEAVAKARALEIIET